MLAHSGVCFDERNYRRHVVVCRAAIDAGRVLASDVLLAVEVRSPAASPTTGSPSPAQHAAAGIPHFWRIEPDVLVQHALDGRFYREVAQFTDEVVVEEPVAVTFRLTGLWT